MVAFSNQAGEEHPPTFAIITTIDILFFRFLESRGLKTGAALTISGDSQALKWHFDDLNSSFSGQHWILEPSRSQ